MRRLTFVTAALQAAATAAGATTGPVRHEAAARIAALERATGGRLGVYARSVVSGRALGYRARERFPLCSTFKVLAVGAVLQRVDRGIERLDREIAFSRTDLLDYAPVTSARLAAGARAMTVGALCEAAIEMSDNAAANLLLASLGGPLAVTRFVRARPFDDPVTRLDRREPALNDAVPGDPRDSSTPERMVRALECMLAGRALSSESARHLLAWMRACGTGLDALRAGLPASWIVADKTGSGARGTRNDVAYVVRPHGGALAIAVYLTGATSIGADRRDATLASVGRIVSEAFGSAAG